MFRPLYAAVVAAVSLMATAVCAQTDGDAQQTAHPAAFTAALNPEAPIQSAPYRSAFDNYQGFVAPEIAGWREANEEVARIGGWKAYAREAQAADDKRGATGSVPAADPHAGHH